ncbi:hypothetical protein DAPPUDRAFT_232850 [Daphnia pulex]|uniref:Uncharacterized protein n=1 Tax=Daphnia pulex TaxID=6669 RepID=E9FSI6_DAPPU|nr:hypothetical protein DAPPUDRAFT_232850 [Daphnia pulex]|eukprot:EFX89825.1 hypothetical protein DAPPUDRAFT_232850 [Daphnia pulex]
MTSGCPPDGAGVFVKTQETVSTFDSISIEWLLENIYTMVKSELLHCSPMCTGLVIARWLMRVSSLQSNVHMHLLQPAGSVTLAGLPPV